MSICTRNLRPKNIEDYNRYTYSSDFNCGGFAINNREWYLPACWRGADTEGIRYDEAMALMEDCALEIAEVGGFKYIDSPEAAAPESEVVGFRFAFGVYGDEEDEWGCCEVEEFPDEESFCGDELGEIEDFHFIARIDGEWYDKPGALEVREFEDDPEGTWSHGRHPYNSRIIWLEREAAERDTWEKISVIWEEQDSNPY